MELNVIMEAMNEINAANTASAESAVSTEHTTEPHAALRIEAQSRMALPEATLQDALEQIVGRFGIEAVLEAVDEIKATELEEAEDVLAELTSVEESILSFHEAEEALREAVEDFAAEARKLQHDYTASFNEGIGDSVMEAQANLEAAEENIASSNSVDRLIHRLESMGISWDESEPAQSHEGAVDEVRKLISFLLQ